MAEYKKQQTCEGNINHSWPVPEEPAIQGQKDRNVGDIIETLWKLNIIDKSYAHMQRKDETLPEPTPVSKIEKSHIEIEVLPDN